MRRQLKWLSKTEVPQWDMFQEPTGLLWIGCLTEIILILKLKFDTLTTRKTSWPRVISHVTNGTIVNICSTSSIPALLAGAKNSSLTSWPNTMAKRMQEQRVEERSAAKSKSAAMNLSSHVPTSSSSPKSPIASQSPGILIAQVKPESKMGGNSESDAASQARLKDAYLGGLMETPTVKLVATKEESWDVDLSESETGSEEDVTGKPAAYKTAAGKPYAPSKSACQGREWSHNLQVSPATIHHTEAVFSIVRGIYGQELDDPLSDFDVNMAIWGIFLNATLRAAVHLGQDYEVNLRYVKNNLWNSVGQLSNETGKLISDQTEITGVKDYWFQRNLRGFRQACCAKKLIGSPTPKPTSSSTLCAAWENGGWSYCDVEEQN